MIIDGKHWLVPSFVGNELVDVFWLRPEQVRVEDVAETLSKINRFNGRTPYPYSVAQHAVLTSHLTAPVWAFEALHHDDTEAYLGDVIGPVKRLLPLVGRIEKRIRRRAIAPAFGLCAHEPVSVKDADYAALRIEQVCLQSRGVPIPPLHTPLSKVKDMLRPLHWRKARDLYLERHWELYGVD